MATQEERSKNILSYFFETDNMGCLSLRKSALLRDLMGVLIGALSQHRVDRPLSVVTVCIQNLLGYGSSSPEPILAMHRAVQLEVLDRFYWFQSARAVIIPFVSPLLKPLVSDENGMSDIKALPAYKTAQFVCSELFVLSLWLVDSSSLADAKINFYLSQLGRDVFTIPVLSTLLSDQAIQKLVCWRLKQSLLGR